MNKKKMTITEALNELKLYDSKINKATSNFTPIVACKKSAKSIGTYSKEELIENIKSDYESIKALIKNRDAIKSAIVTSNATTYVQVNGVTMTVAQAIERKNSIRYEQDLLNVMKRTYASANTTHNIENSKVDAQVDKMLESFLGKDTDKKIAKEEIEIIEKPYREKNEFELIDPLKIEKEMKELEDEIMGFESNVDTVLVISNATTFIEVEV